MLKSVKITYDTKNRSANKVIVDGQDISHGVISAIANITADGVPYCILLVRIAASSDKSRHYTCSAAVICGRFEALDRHYAKELIALSKMFPDE